MKRATQKPDAARSAPSTPAPLGEVLRAALSSGAAGRPVVLDERDCRAVLAAVAQARQPPAPVAADAVTAFRVQVGPVPECTACRAASSINCAPMACWHHALNAAVAPANEAAQLRAALHDVLALVQALPARLTESESVPGQVLAGLCIQVEALARAGGLR